MTDIMPQGDANYSNDARVLWHSVFYHEEMEFSDCFHYCINPLGTKITFKVSLPKPEDENGVEPEFEEKRVVVEKGTLLARGLFFLKNGYLRLKYTQEVNEPNKVDDNSNDFFCKAGRDDNGEIILVINTANCFENRDQRLQLVSALETIGQMTFQVEVEAGNMAFIYHEKTSTPYS